MSVAYVEADAARDARSRALRRSRSEIAGWLALTLLVAVGAPLFVRMGPWVDVTHYDLAARNILRGGVHYRDVFDTNLPGMVWLHAIVRAALGWSFEAIRAVDLVIVACAAGLLIRWLTAAGVPRVARVWTAAAFAAFYFFVPEWSHCQRDFWMLPPALAAAGLRLRQIESLERGDAPSALAARALVEGACWALAAWIKPFVMIPAAAVWLAGYTGVGHRLSMRRALVDAAGVVAGSVLVIAGGVVWLVSSGAWPYFWQVMFDWNPEYLGGHAYHWHARWDVIRMWANVTRPWSYTVLIAMVVAVAALGWRRVNVFGQPVDSPSVRLFAAFYLGWLLQAAVLQPRAHAYVMDAAVMVGIPLVSLGVTLALERRRRPTALVLLACVAFAAARHPLLRIDRLALLGPARDARGGAALRDLLSLHAPTSVGRIGWTDLEKTAAYLRTARVQDGELLCFNDATHPLYLMLDLRPPVRYLQFGIVIHTMTRHREDVRREMDAARVRFVVSDLRGAALPSRAGAISLAPAWRRLYPWTLPVVFRAGPYSVHRADGPVTRFWP